MCLALSIRVFGSTAEASTEQTSADGIALELRDVAESVETEDVEQPMATATDKANEAGLRIREQSMWYFPGRQVHYYCCQAGYLIHTTRLY